MLRSDLTKERQKTTALELKVVEQENQVEEMQRQLTMIKKREDLLKQSNQELNYEIEKLRENDANNNSFMSNSSF
jgi:septal ring factor EnvC (AmiA/AmiB activator)